MNALHTTVIRMLSMGRLFMEQLVNELIEANVGRVLVDEPLARYTTMKIGGPADILIVPKHVAGIEKRCS